MKLCKDCKWLRPPNPRRPICGHPSSVLKGEIDSVTGEMSEDRPLTCEDARMFLAHDGSCGREGTHWEAADATPVGFT
jgi:hypothetical protein